MPEKATVQRAKRKLRAGARPSTAAGEFIREEIHHVRQGKHGVRSTKQAIAIGLAKARRAGIPLPSPKAGRTNKRTRKQAAADRRAAKHPHVPSERRSRAMKKALQREPHAGASHRALSRQAHRAAARRTPAARSAAARKGAATRARNRARK